jgi:hypothetical protein
MCPLVWLCCLVNIDGLGCVSWYAEGRHLAIFELFGIFGDRPLTLVADNDRIRGFPPVRRL